MQARRAGAREDRPISVLEVEVDAGYRDIALSLAARAKSLGFTHVELHFPRDAFFAPAVHFGATEDLMFLVDTLHQDGIGVFFAWSPAEFPPDPHGLSEWDGMPTFEADDSTRQIHPVSGQGLFDLSKPAVQSLLLSSALFWVEELHADGLRVDHLATAVYLDDRRAPGTWSPNAKGGRENLDGFAFVQRLVKTLKSKHPEVHVIADDSITKSADVAELGFERRCDATWVDDLRFHLGLDPRARAHHDLPELPTASDVFVAIDGAAAAGSLDPAARKLFLAIAWALPGKKLVLMSDDGAMEPTIADLNRAYSQTPGLRAAALSPVECGADLLAFKRGEVLVVANLSHEPRKDAVLAGTWKVLLDTGRETDESDVLESPELPPRSALFLVPA
jgi:1,4-alpha-glucan branching enzyme